MDLKKIIVESVLGESSDRLELVYSGKEFDIKIDNFTASNKFSFAHVYDKQGNKLGTGRGVNAALKNAKIKPSSAKEAKTFIADEYMKYSVNKVGDEYELDLLKTSPAGTNKRFKTSDEAIAFAQDRNSNLRKKWGV